MDFVLKPILTSADFCVKFAWMASLTSTFVRNATTVKHSDLIDLLLVASKTS